MFSPDRHADAQRQLHGGAGHAARFGQQLKARRGRTCVQRRRDGLVRVLAPERGNSLAVRLPRDDGPAAKIFAPFAVRLAPAVDRGGNRRGAAAVTTVGTALTAILYVSAPPSASAAGASAASTAHTTSSAEIRFQTRFIS